MGLQPFHFGENSKSQTYIDKLNALVQVANKVDHLKVHGATLTKTPDAYIINAKPQTKKRIQPTETTETIDFIYPTERIGIQSISYDANSFYILEKEHHERRWIWIDNSLYGYAKIRLPANPALEDTYFFACYHRNHEVGIFPNYSQTIKMPQGDCYGTYLNNDPETVTAKYVRMNDDFYASSITTLILTCCDPTGGDRAGGSEGDTNASAIWIPIHMEATRIKTDVVDWY